MFPTICTLDQDGNRLLLKLNQPEMLPITKLQTEPNRDKSNRELEKCRLEDDQAPEMRVSNRRLPSRILDVYSDC